jgi:hypothetical protein
MKQVMLASVAAIALAAGSTVALSQQGAPGAGQGGTAGGAQGGASGTMNAPMQSPGGASGQMNESPAPGPGRAPAKGAQDRTIPEKQKSTQQAPARGQAAPQQQGQAAPHQQPSQKSAQDKQDRNPVAAERHDGNRQGAAEHEKGGTRQGANERGMTTKNVSLTTEQKTVIRTKVLTSSAPRVTNVNFDIHVGTVVPRTVRVAPIPVALIDIEPAWRGYMYFVHADEIIVVEPRTLRIVAVLEV